MTKTELGSEAASFKGSRFFHLRVLTADLIRCIKGCKKLHTLYSEEAT